MASEWINFELIQNYLNDSETIQYWIDSKSFLNNRCVWTTLTKHEENKIKY